MPRVKKSANESEVLVFTDPFADSGFALICGVDEAGRGPLCGPVVAAACILPADCVIDELNDSKS